jgi:hypothetical protein
MVFRFFDIHQIVTVRTNTKKNNQTDDVFICTPSKKKKSRKKTQIKTRIRIKTKTNSAILSFFSL